MYYPSKRFGIFCLLSFFVLAFVFITDYYLKKTEFTDVSNQFARQVSERALIADSALQIFSTYVFSQENLNHYQTAELAHSLIYPHPFLYMFEVATKFDDENSKQNEIELAKVFPDLFIRKFDNDVTGKSHNTDAEYYYSISFQEPYYIDKLRLIGADLFSSEPFIEAMAKSIGKDTAIASRAFFLAEDVNGYVIHRPAPSNTVKSREPITGSVYTLLAIDSEKLISGLLEGELVNFEVTVYHAQFTSEDGSYPIVFKSNPVGASHKQTNLFPHFSMQETLSQAVPSQPFIIHTSWQSGWQDFRYSLFISLLFISAAVFVFIKKYSDQHFKEKLEQMSVDGKLYYMANFDALTGIPNRHRFQEHLEHSVAMANRGGERFSIFFMDIDKFKAINDTYGHAAGDITLKEVAKRLSILLRKDELLARYGGDEFILVSNRSISYKEIVEIIKRLKKQFIEPVEIQNKPLDVEISIGYATYPDDAGNIDALLGVADRRMYEDKTDFRI